MMSFMNIVYMIQEGVLSRFFSCSNLTMIFCERLMLDTLTPLTRSVDDIEKPRDRTDFKKTS